MKAFHDVHVHNYLSSCSPDNQATAAAMIAAAKELGIRLMGFANHTWDESVPLPAPSSFYKRQSMAFQRQIRTEIPADLGDLKVLIGAETEYCGMYDVLGMGKEAALELDFLLIPHTHVHMRNFVMPATADVTRGRSKLAEVLAGIEGITPERAAAMAKSCPEKELEPFMGEKTVDYIKFVSDFMVESFRGLVNNETLKSYSDLVPISIAHPFAPVGDRVLSPEMTALISDNTYGELFEMAAKRGIGIEINGETNTPEQIRMLGCAKEAGCKFTLGSDGHFVPEMMRELPATEGAATALGLTEYDFMDFVRQ